MSDSDVPSLYERTETSAEAQGKLLLEWLRRVRVNIDSHNLAERYYRRRNVSLTVVAVAALVTLGVSSTSFGLGSGDARWFGLALSLIGVTASTLQGVLDFGASALANRVAARQFAALRRGIESALCMSESDRAFAIKQIAREWDIVSASSENVPAKIRRVAEAKVRNDGYLPIYGTLGRANYGEPAA
jgi:hypothetical protein